MDRKSRISSVGRVVSITRRRIRIIVPLNAERPRDAVRLVLAGSLGILALWYAANVVLNTYKAQREANKEQTAAQQRPANTIPLAGVPTSPQTERTQQQSPHWYSSLSDILNADAAPQWFLVLIGAVTAAAALKTLRAINSEVKATAKAADAAEKSADIADRALVATQRPFLMFKNLEMHPALNEEKVPYGWVFFPVFENTGNTPALRAEAWREVFFDDGSGHPEGISPPSIGTPPPSTIPVARSGIIKADPFMLTFDQMETTWKHKRAICVHAKAIYRDGFPSTPPRTTQVCFELIPLRDIRDVSAKESPIQSRSAGKDHSYAD